MAAILKSTNSGLCQFAQTNFTHTFWLILLMAAILNCAILDSVNFAFNHYEQSNPFNLIQTHSFSLNLMMAAILNSAMLDSATAMLDSDTLLCSLRFTQKHSHCTLTLTQPNSIWLKLIHSHLTWWLQPSWILPSSNQPFWTTKFLHSFLLTQPDDVRHLEFCHLGFNHYEQKKTSLIHSHSTWWWSGHLEFCHLGFNHFEQKKTSLIHSDSSWWLQPSWIPPSWIQPLPSWIQTPCYLLSDSLKNTLTPIWLWLKLIQSDSNSFILTQLDDGRHLEFHHHEFCHLGFSHLSISSQTHSHLPRLVPTICT